MVVRYGDLDAQGHVNNARYLTYMEQARVGYFTHLGLWDGRSFLDTGVILADIHITFRQSILLGQDIRVGIRVCKLGNKSLDVEQSIEDASTGQIMASASMVLVAFVTAHSRASLSFRPGARLLPFLKIYSWINDRRPT